MSTVDAAPQVADLPSSEQPGVRSAPVEPTAQPDGGPPDEWTEIDKPLNMAKDSGANDSEGHVAGRITPMPADEPKVLDNGDKVWGDGGFTKLTVAADTGEPTVVDPGGTSSDAPKQEGPITFNSDGQMVIRDEADSEAESEPGDATGDAKSEEAEEAPELTVDQHAQILGKAEQEAEDEIERAFNNGEFQSKALKEAAERVIAAKKAARELSRAKAAGEPQDKTLQEIVRSGGGTKAYISLLKNIKGDKAAEIFDRIEPYVVVRFDGEAYLLTDLLSGKTNLTQEQVNKAINEGVFNQNPDINAELDYFASRKIIDAEIDALIVSTQMLLEAYKGKKAETATLQERLRLLNFAKQAEGEGGGIVGVTLIEKYGGEEKNARLDVYKTIVRDRSIQAINRGLIDANYSPLQREAILDFVKNNKWEELAKIKGIENSGLDKIVFGKNAYKVMRELAADPKRKNLAKSGLLAFFLIMASAAIELKNNTMPK